MKPSYIQLKHPVKKKIFVNKKSPTPSRYYAGLL